MVDVDNITIFHPYRKGRAGDKRIHNLISFRSWLQVGSDFTLKLKWVCSADTNDADDLTRLGEVEHVRLEQRCFGRLRAEMATGTSVQWRSSVDRDADRVLPFYSRYHTAVLADADVLGQDVSHMPSFANACFGLCFAPSPMVAVVLPLEILRSQSGGSGPDDRQASPRLAAATVRWVPVAARRVAGSFFRMHHQKGKAVFLPVRHAGHGDRRQAEMKARQRIGPYWYIGRYTTARHRFTPDREHTSNPVRFPTSPVSTVMPSATCYS